MSTEPSAETEIYPMSSFPTLVVSDIQASVLWYCDILGFTNVFTMPGPNGVPTMVHLRWGKYADLLLFPDRNNSLANKPKGIGVALNYSTGISNILPNVPANTMHGLWKDPSTVPGISAK